MWSSDLVPFFITHPVIITGIVLDIIVVVCALLVVPDEFIVRTNLRSKAEHPKSWSSATCQVARIYNVAFSEKDPNPNLTTHSHVLKRVHFVAPRLHLLSGPQE